MVELCADKSLHDPILRWKMLKCNVKAKVQDFTKFWKKQHNSTLSSLRRCLRSINIWIYKGETLLEQDRLRMQVAITQEEQTIWEKDKYKQIEWLLHEGKYHPDFLHLEDIKTSLPKIDQIKRKDGTLATDSEVLGTLKDFYADLYSSDTSVTQEEIKSFLHSIPRLLHLQDLEIEGSPIVEQHHEFLVQL